MGQTDAATEPLLPVHLHDPPVYDQSAPKRQAFANEEDHSLRESYIKQLGYTPLIFRVRCPLSMMGEKRAS